MKTTISIAVLLLALFTTIFTESNLLAASNAGRNFTVCFPKNFLNNDDAESKYAQLWLYIAAADTMSSKGNIYFYQNNKKETITFTVEKDSMIVIEIPKNLEILSDSIIEKKSISIVSDFNITVFGLSYDYATSDGFMAMPDIALDTSYIVASFGSKAVTGPNANLLYRYSGGVVIAALEDNTIVHVKSPAKFKNPVSEPYQDVTLFLNAGETRYLRAVDTLLMDVTGTIIHANKKISVFSTHQRVSIPNNTNGLTTNVLIEQTQPISILGNSIICTPHKSPSSKLKTLIRIIVPFDSTFIKVKNTVELLNAGTFKELFIIDTAEIIETSKPVLVAQYEQSSFINSKNEKIGDPFLLFVPPIQQFITSCTFISPPIEQFTEHWVNIIIHKESIHSFRLDNFKYPDSIFQSVNGTQYVFCRIKIPSGVHHAIADSAFGILVYGYGNIDGYGYCGGQDTHRLLELILDNNPTKIITTTNDCSEVVIQLSEVQEFDSGIDMIDIFDILNVNYTVPNYNIGDRSLTITASLLDNNFDGYFRFSTRDRKGLNTIGSVSIKGFTIDTKIIRKTDTIIFGNLRCDSLLLVNYGRFPQTISWHLAQNTAFSIPPTTLVAEIAPHDSVSIPFYTEGKQIGDIEDILQLSDLCNRSKLFSIQATCVPPLFFGESGCSLPVTLQFNPLHLLEAHNLVLRIDIPDIAQVHIMNTLGQRVLYETGITAKSISSLDVSHLSEGVYYIELRTVKGNNFGQIIMINK